MLIYPNYTFKTRKNKNSETTEIWDEVRRQWVLLTPEEFVRQHFIHYLIHEKNYPIETIIVEKEIQVFEMKKRFDVAVIHKTQEFILVAECKAPSVQLNSSVIEQVLTYNLRLNAQCFVITNGLQQFVFEKQNNQWIKLPDIKKYT